jgi:aspartate ammonia-lyase
MHIGMALGNSQVIAAFEELIGAFKTKAQEFSSILKMGRTQLQDAVPMTLGQEFKAFARTLADEVRALEAVKVVLCEVSMGGTAIGTGLNAPKGYAKKCARELARLTGKPIIAASDLIAATSSLQGFVTYSAAVRGLAVTLSKIASDLILLGSGPRAGLNELSLPAIQPGSSIMPGKVNPVMPEVLNVVAFRVIGNDLAVTLAAREGQLQLNAYEPLVAIAILESQDLLEHVMAAFRTQCVDGITVNERNLARHIEETVGIVTALNPVIGYERATELATEAYRSNKGILEIVREKHILTEDQIRALLDPAKLTGLDRGAYPKTKKP